MECDDREDLLDSHTEECCKRLLAATVSSSARHPERRAQCSRRHYFPHLRLDDYIYLFFEVRVFKARREPAVGELRVRRRERID